MIIKYYGGYYKKSTLLEMTKTNKNGTTAYNLKETLENLGFNVKGVKASIEEYNKDNIILPAIASVTIDNSLKHFVVIYEINFKSKYLIIGDPASKIKKMTFNEFNKIFNNVLLLFYPLKKLQIEKDISKIKFLFSIVKPQKKELKSILLLSIFITSFSIVTSFYTEYMINGINYYSKIYLIKIFIIFLTIYILKNISIYFRNITISFINQKIDLNLTIDVFNKVINLPYRYYKNKTTGDVITRISDIDNIKDMTSKVYISVFIDFPLAFISLVVLYIISSKLFFVGIIILILYLIIIFLFRNYFYEYIKKIKLQKGETASYMVETISGFETIKGIHIENNIKERFEYKYVKYLKDILKCQNVYHLQYLLKELVDNIGFIIIIYLGSIMVINNELTLGTLLTFSSLLIYFLEPIKNIINLDSTFKEFNVSLNRIKELDIDNKENGIEDNIKNNCITFKGLSFSFDNRNYILNNINLTIKEKSKVMVVGKSGSGKSTLFKLLLKYYNIFNDKIFLGNIDVNNITPKAINDNIVYINQNEILFNDTLKNNLVFENSDLNNLLNISKMCYIDEFIDSNLGFNMLIEENGFNLSGGERQRVMLARALLRKFNILIIDEGLNQVDVSLERKILKNLFEHFKDKTIIVISHRLDNLDLFDSLIKFENNKVELIERNV